jgi:hypothetical protein
MKENLSVREESNEINTSERNNSFGLSPLQKGMLLNSYLHPNDGVDILHITVELNESIDSKKLKNCIQKTFENHDIFRSSFDNSDPLNPLHLIADTVIFDFEVYDFQNVPSNEFKAAYDDFFASDRLRGIDLNNGPLMRFNLIKQSEENFYLIWTWHHILIDARPIPSLLITTIEVGNHVNQVRNLLQLKAYNQ